MARFDEDSLTMVNASGNEASNSSVLYTTNSTRNASLNATLPTDKSSTIQTVRITIYAVSILLGLVGNSLVILVSILRRKKLRRSQFLIAHLSFTDIIFTLRLPLQIVLELDARWRYGVAFCKVFHGVNSMSMLASIGTMTVLAVERYRGITKPFLAKIKRSTLIFSLATVWLISALAYAPAFAFRKVVDEKCKEKHPSIAFGKAYITILVFIKYILPLSIIGWCYFKIVHTIRKRPIIGEQASQLKQRRQDDKRIVRLLVVMVIAFAVMTLPASIWWFLHDYGLFASEDGGMQIMEVFASMVYLHSCINPILYFIMDGKFRSDVLDLCKRHRPNRSNITPHSANNNDSASRRVGNINDALVKGKKPSLEFSSTRF